MVAVFDDSWSFQCRTPNSCEEDRICNRVRKDYGFPLSIFEHNLNPLFLFLTTRVFSDIQIVFFDVKRNESGRCRRKRTCGNCSVVFSGFVTAAYERGVLLQWRVSVRRGILGLAHGLPMGVLRRLVLEGSRTQDS